MPEHVHLLVSEPERSQLAVAIQMLKQNVSHALRRGKGLWLPRYYDLNVWSHGKIAEKLDYMHENPVERGLVVRAQDWSWSSCQHYLTGTEGVVEIESHWTARKRELRGELVKFSRV
jgi:putative transposase